MRIRLLSACSASVASAIAILSCVGSDPDPDPRAYDDDDGGAAPAIPGPTIPGSDDAQSNSDARNPGMLDSGAFDSGALDSGTIDSGTIDSGTIDSGTIDSGRACDPAKAFNAASTATLMALNTATLDIPMRDQFTPRLSADELTIYYGQYPGIVGGDIAPAADIYFASRAIIADSFGTGNPLLDVDSQHLEEDLSLTSDGLTIFFATNRLDKTDCAGGVCIARASRASLTAGFIDAGLVVNNLGDQRYPYAAGSGPTLYYAASSATTGWDITSSAGSEKFVNVNGPGEDTSPVLSPDELVLYFASDRDSDGGNHLDIWVATRGNKNDVFGAPTRVDALSTPRDELPGFVSADGCRLYLTRDDEAAGGLNLYVAAKPN